MNQEKLDSLVGNSWKIRQAHQAVMLEDTMKGLALERAKEKALHAYHDIPLKDVEDDTIHIGDLNITNSPGAGGGVMSSTDSSSVNAAPRRNLVGSALKYLAITAAVVSGGWTVTSLGWLAVQALSQKQPPAAPTPSPPKPDLWKDFNLEAIDD